MTDIERLNKENIESQDHASADETRLPSPQHLPGESKLPDHCRTQN
jgi:hypothetical protein